MQDAYVEKVVDTLNDLPNVLWMVAQEAARSTWWNDHHIAPSQILRVQQAVSASDRIWRGRAAFVDSILINSDADWIAPSARLSPTTSCGTGTPPCKVSINDSDHSFFGLWNDNEQERRHFAWQNFMNGNQVMFMDPYVVSYPREGRNLCVSPVSGICTAPGCTMDDNFRDIFGYILQIFAKAEHGQRDATGSLCSHGILPGANTGRRR